MALEKRWEARTEAARSQGSTSWRAWSSSSRTLSRRASRSARRSAPPLRRDLRWAQTRDAGLTQSLAKASSSACLPGAACWRRLSGASAMGVFGAGLRTALPERKRRLLVFLGVGTGGDGAGSRRRRQGRGRHKLLERRPPAQRQSGRPAESLAQSGGACQRPASCAQARCLGAAGKGSSARREGGRLRGREGALLRARCWHLAASTAHAMSYPLNYLNLLIYVICILQARKIAFPCQKRTNVCGGSPKGALSGTLSAGQGAEPSIPAPRSGDSLRDAAPCSCRQALVSAPEKAHGAQRLGAFLRLQHRVGLLRHAGPGISALRRSPWHLHCRAGRHPRHARDTLNNSASARPPLDISRS